MENRSTLRVLALDFDGVIWDSVGECFEVGWRAYKELVGRELSGAVYREGFLGGRPLARTGSDFFILLSLLEQDPTRDLSALSFQEFLVLRQRHAEQMGRYNKIFYDLRSHYRDTDMEQWASWQGPYASMLAFMDAWESKFVGAALATTKDTRSAQALLSTTGRDWPVFGKEFSVDKEQQIRGIAELFKVQPSEILFVDDLLENLEQVAPTGARTALARWGYNTAESRDEAEQLGYPVVSVEELPELISGWLEGCPA